MKRDIYQAESDALGRMCKAARGTARIQSGSRTGEPLGARMAGQVPESVANRAHGEFNATRAPRRFLTGAV